MAKVKLTKNELKAQKDALKRFQRYLPTLQLKKQQLQIVVRQVEAKQRAKLAEREDAHRNVRSWIAVFGERIAVDEYLSVESLDTEIGNIAGIDIPVFKGLTFEDVRYDLFLQPLWVDEGVAELKRLVSLDAELRVLERQHDLLSEELRITTQRVNLFEKVKIPETKENIRKIRIYLGDQQTAAVVRGKIAKNNIVKAEQA